MVPASTKNDIKKHSFIACSKAANEDCKTTSNMTAWTYDSNGTLWYTQTITEFYRSTVVPNREVSTLRRMIWNCV